MPVRLILLDTAACMYRVSGQPAGPGNNRNRPRTVQRCELRACTYPGSVHYTKVQDLLRIGEYSLSACTILAEHESAQFSVPRQVDGKRGLPLHRASECRLSRVPHQQSTED